MRLICIFCLGAMPAYIAKDEKVIELQGEALRVRKALDRVLGHLRKYLVDQSVIPLFEKTVSSFMYSSQP